MPKELGQYLDARGWICHAKKDENGWPKTEAGKFLLEGGDGCQRMSMNSIFNFVNTKGNPFEQSMVRANFLVKLRDIWLPSGEPVRHWSRLEWYGKEGCMSGDQLEPLMWAMVIFGMWNEYWSLFFKIAKRGFFAWNTKKIGQVGETKKIPDFMLFRLVSPSIRMLSSVKWLRAPSWLVLLVWDVLWLGLNTLVRVLYPFFDREDTGDDLNFVVSLIGSKLVCDTPGAWLARLFYFLRPRARFKNLPEFNHDQEFETGPQSAFNQYFYELAAPPLNEKARSVLEWL